MTCECLNCINKVEDNEWFCCNACRDKYMYYMQRVTILKNNECRAEAKLRKSEIIAFGYLSNLGYKLERCVDVGYPDFRVKNKNMWFEIKTPGAGLNQNQIKQFSMMLNEKHVIYIVYMDKKIMKIFNLKLFTI